ncbi:tRNA (cytosine(34)-C(5))-methyltransferase [Camellia lanceoleosa]|uniref:tRNA (Cytosine(34)-C(5))-methyltransferase n=1 Tax=Camellia lanceoleosa TaxID=1840588 RepID=A0ACC0IV87_9ERIC|nr:tRNA (cytosine(34)-C(5))-methyltransferase [Camellia lanceoleosa]
MGGRGRSRTQRKHFRESRDNVWKHSRSDSQQQEQEQEQDDNGNNKSSNNKNPSWEPFATQNPSFDEYYKEQGIVSPEEWDAFIEVLRKPLPAAFRINSSSQFCGDIRMQLENDFMKCLQAEAADGSEVVGIRPLPWYPENLAWHSNFSRMQLRKNQTLERFHEFLKLENEIGNITRQEAVSMVPPLFLDVHPDHFVLDMCAAPGSKTFQLLEMIYESIEPGSLPSGMVVANDVDVQRCNLLIHQTKRMCTANLIVTNHEAQHFPSCHLNKNYANALENGVAMEPSVSQLLFDRVLCDVPCSGDGTLRKAPDIWRKWSVGMGNGIHGLQVQIAMRGISLLKVGGRIVYSTCSMNPVENEAVVAEILRRCGGSVELLDVSSELPQLVRRPGLKKWKVRDKGIWLASYKDVSKFRRAGITPSMFPSGKSYMDTSENDNHTELGERHDNGGDENSEKKDLEALTDVLDEEISSLPLERCMRIVPHDQNTGAFFIAVLHKLSPLPAIQKKPTSLYGKLKSNNTARPEKLAKDVKEDINGVEFNSTDVTEEQLPEAVSSADLLAASDADLLGNELEESALNTDPSKMCDEIEPKEIQDPVDKETGLEKVGGKRKLQSQGKWKGVDPVVFFSNNDIVDSIMTFYGIDESFPFSGHLVTRNSDTNHVKRIYYVSKSVKDILELNLKGGQQLKITSIGLKMFERQSSKEGSLSPCAFRISSEGLPLLLPHITKQIVHASTVDFKHLLEYKTIKFADFVDAEFGEKASKLMLGCCVVVLRKDGESSADPPKVDASTIAIGCWRGRTNVSVMVTAIDCREMLERLSMRMGTKNGSELPETKPSNADPEELGTNDVESKEDAETSEMATVG